MVTEGVELTFTKPSIFKRLFFSMSCKVMLVVVIIVKNPGTEDQALFYPQRGFALLKVH